jgi:hypothetical protein
VSTIKNPTGFSRGSRSEDIIASYDPDKHLSEDKYYLERGRIIGLLDARILIKKTKENLQKEG